MKLKTLFKTLLSYTFASSAALLVGLYAVQTIELSAETYDGSMPELKVLSPTAAQRFVVKFKDATIAFVPYGPNIIRVTVTPGTEDRVISSGWGTIESPNGESDWNFKDDSGSAYLTSPVMALHIDKQGTGFEALRSDGSSICKFLGDAFSPTINNKVETGHVVGTFSVNDNEHFFGLGEHQDGHLDLRGQNLSVWHHYGNHETIGFPFLVSTGNYAIMWDNLSRTQVACAINGKTTWDSEAGDSVAFFLIVGKNSDEIYSGYRALTGTTPMPSKASLGFIQSKARYTSQKELLEVAKGYRQRHYPCDVVVVDYLSWVKLGDLSLDPKYWPDPKAMNDELHQTGFHSLVSVWPGFAQGSKYYDKVVSNKWVFTNADGSPTAMPRDPSFHRDADVDSTNPQARAWFWNQVSENYYSEGFDYFWLDETEPDIEWHDSNCFLGPCAKFYNLYPLVHSAAIYQGMRSSSNNRVLILIRAAYLGAQRYGTSFWSSDISSTWDAFRNQVTTGLNMCASGLPYWSSDTGGWAPLPSTSHPAHFLLNPNDAREVVGQNDDYPELFVRWFEFSTFCPTFRAHGNRKGNEVWSFGKAAEPILVKYLNLRYQLMPYIYSQAHFSEETGAPFMRALFMDFPNDPQAVSQKDEYMFGPAFLVAPVLSQDTVEQSVYLPAGTDWYDFWTNQKYHGGQTIIVSAPIDTLPLFVRAGSVLPLGSRIETTETPQTISEIRVYQGADGLFSLYEDDGHTYDYESGKFSLSKLKYDEASKSFTTDRVDSAIDPNLKPTLITGDAK